MDKPVNPYAPVRRPKALPAGKDDSSRKQPLFPLEFWVCFVSFSMLSLSSLWGTLAIVGFLAPWGLIVLRQSQNVQRGILKNWPLLLLPTLVIVSTAWSDEPRSSLRGGVEEAVTIAIGIMAGYCIKPKTLIAALLSMLILIAVACLVAGHEEIISTTGEHAFAGIFGSKNAFAGMMSLLLLVSVAVYLDKEQPRFFRAAAVAGILFTPILIYHGRSLDAILSASFAITVFLIVRFLRRYTPRTRLFVCALIVLIGLSVTLVASFTEFDTGSVLHFMGKDSSLTGRTLIWKRGLQAAAERPLLGYGVFWRLNNPKAQQIWYETRVPAGSGLGFHSEYIEALVDYGILGLTLVLAYFYVLTKRAIKGVLGTMSAEQNFAFILFVFYIIRTPVEVGLFGQFNMGTILFCIMWIYLRQLKVPAKGTNLLLNRVDYPRKNKATAY